MEVLIMHAWEAIQRTVNHIEDNLTDEFTIKGLAEIASLSPFYFQRLFTRLVRKPVNEYIKLRRLARACETLLYKQSRIADVAFICGFNSHESFTRAFKDAYGLPPREYRDKPIPLNQFIKPDLSLEYTYEEENIPLITEDIVIEIFRKEVKEPIVFIGVKGHVSISQQFPPGEITGVDELGQYWNKFHQEKSSISGLLKGGAELDAIYIGDAAEGYFTFFAGGQAEEGAAVDTYPTWTLEAGEYLVCGYEAENFKELVNNALDKAIKYFGCWIKRNQIITDSTFAVEMYYTSSPESTYMEQWMRLAPGE